MLDKFRYFLSFNNSNFEIPMTSQKTFIIWNDDWDEATYLPYEMEFYINDGPGIQEVKVTRVGVACTSNLQDSDEPTNLVSIVVKKPGEFLRIPFDADGEYTRYSHKSTFDRTEIPYSNFFDLDGVFTHNINVSVRLSPGESLYLVITPWTPPTQNVNVQIDYEVKNIRG